MALHRAQLCRRGSRNGSEKGEEEEEEEGDGYIQVFVRPLEQGRCGLVLGWLGLSGASLTAQQVGALYGLGALATSACVYQLLRCDVGLLFYRLCGLAVPMFSIVCAFYWLSLCFRKTWSNTSVYLLFSSCYVGETLAQILACGDDRGGPSPSPSSSSSVTQPLVVFAVLLSVSLASLFSSLETAYSAVVILVVSSARLLACTALADLPQGLRPYIAYSCGFGGIIVSKYMETVFRPPVNNYMTQDGKIPVIKRRRSSSSSSHGFSTHRSTRRTSLPALIQRSQSSAASYESAVIGEAHGLITDMLAESSLPPHIVSGLRAVSNLLKPPESHPAIHKTKVSPLVSLTESTSYGSDSEDLPYTGERPSSLPKRLRRSLPPNLIRRMSTSTWTTTTSATGMPTLEPEPSRIRSSSFRHSRDGTPASSPVGSRSNSPSPSSPTTVVLSIPKSRSFSLANTSTGLPVHSRRLTRKGILLPSSDHTSTSPTKLDTKPMSPLTKGELHQEEIDGSKYTGGRDTQTGPLRRLNITSDYESSDSPSSSDHSDNVMTSDDLSGSPPKKLGGRMEGDNQFRETANFHSSSKERGDDEDDRLVPNDSSSQDKARPEKKSGGDVQEEWELPYTSADLDNCALLRIEWLNDWDYPIFKMAENKGKFILSQVACKLFMEVGLFETFRIPEVQFIHYFHSLEMGYREKPYHNRVHATDVLHGVYYLTTQRIPGFQQVNCTDLFNRLCSSSESESDSAEKLGHTHRATFSTDDSYGIMGANFPALELMALYTAAAMHDYDHPGRTNAFLVATHAPQAVLYNDRSVLENHHAASAWQLLLSHHNHNFLCGLDKAEFKRFRFLVIEAILATDLKRHFEILAEFNAKVNEDDAPGIDWTVESDRLLVMQMLIKLADINGPAKRQELHTQWTHRISEEFYEQGDEEARRGMPISPYMDRRNPQLAKLQESFINHLVAPLCNAMVSGGLLPGTWVDPNGEELSDSEKGENSAFKDTEDETDQDMGGSFPIKQTKKTRKINCLLTKNLKENHEMWVAKIKEEQQKQAAAEIEQEKNQILQGAEGNGEKPEMESIKEELEGSPVSTNNAQSRCCCRHSPLESHRSSET